jgi:hypothetical protein
VHKTVALIKKVVYCYKAMIKEHKMTYSQYIQKWTTIKNQIEQLLLTLSKTQNFKLLNQLIEEESQLSNSNIKYLRMNGENIENLYYKIILHPELKLDIK